MGFGALRSLVRPVSRALTTVPLQATPFPAARSALFSSPSISPISYRSLFSLTDTRFPKRRPSLESRRKRGSMKPPGPFKMVQYVPGEIITEKPNEGSVKRRNEKKRMKLRMAFIKSEKKKRKVLHQEAKKKKIIKRVERKMAAVARDRAWAERLTELQRLEEERKNSTA